MTIVPGMWYKLLHGNPEGVRQCIYVVEVQTSWWFGTKIHYKVIAFKPSASKWIETGAEGLVSKEDFERCFEPVTM